MLALQEFLTSIDHALLPADVTMDTHSFSSSSSSSSSSLDYYEGCLLAEVRDHRLVNHIDLKPRVYRVLLQVWRMLAYAGVC